MRDTIDFGIDLGTTNSAIAVADGTTATVLKNSDQRETTPSAVWLPRAGQVFVGQRAFERVYRDASNAAGEFKQYMGQSGETKHFQRAGTSMTPPELSAEVLKALRTNAKLHGAELPDSAVITVPAGFTLNQNQATIEAAELAGLGSACPLVPEPTAAAIAYGLDAGAGNGYWMVFDFGGGTFDAAIVSKRDGELQVLNHAGDNGLGGKLIDWALVERVLAPAAADELGLRDFHRGNGRWAANFATLKLAAEQAKIQLSVDETAIVNVDLLDDDGADEMFELVVSRSDLDAIADPFYTRAIHLCRKALADAALDTADIDRLVLVGGTTLAQGLRDRLADPAHGLGIELDISLDPTTAVARGAAIYASTIRREPTETPEPLAGEFAVSLHYEPRVNTRTTTVAGTVHSSSTSELSGYEVVVANPEGRPAFRSPRTGLNDKGAFVVEVDLDPYTKSHFVIELTDSRGTPCALTPAEFSITHGDTAVGELGLGHSLGILLEDQSFAPVLAKGRALPATETKPFSTTRTLRRSELADRLRIPLLQGERARGARNRQVGTLEIRPGDLEFDLPEGTDIDVTFTVDRSNLLTVIARVPLAELQVEAKIDMAGVRAPAPEVLEVQLAEVKDRLTGMRSLVTQGSSPDAERRLAQLDAEDTIAVARDQVRAAAVDPSAAKYAEDRLRDVQAELDEIEDALSLTDLVQDLQYRLNKASQLVDDVGSPTDRTKLDTLTARAHDAIRRQEAPPIRTASDRVVEFVVELESRAPDWPLQVFYLVARDVDADPRATRLLEEGRRAATKGDMRALDDINRRLVELLPDELRDGAHGPALGRRRSS